MGSVLEAAKGALLAVAAATLGGVGDVMEGIVLIGAAGATLGWLYARVARPAAGMLLRTYHALDALEELPDFMARTDERFRDGSANFEALDARLGVVEERTTSTENLAAGVARELAVPVRDLSTRDLSDT